MRRLAQFVRLRASRVCVCLSASRVCICLASACICLASVSHLSRVLSRVCVSHLVSRRSSCLASVSRRSSCLASVSRQGFRMLASVCVCLLVNACGNWLILCVGRHSKSLKGFCYRHTIYPLVGLYEQTFNILI